MKFSNQILVMWLLLAMSQLSILEARAGGRSSRKVGEEIEIVGSRQILTGRDSGSADDSTTDDSTTDDSTTDDSTTDDSTTDDSTTDDSTTDDSTTDDSTTDDSTTDDSTTDDSTTDDSTTDDSTTDDSTTDDSTTDDSTTDDSTTDDSTTDDSTTDDSTTDDSTTDDSTTDDSTTDDSTTDDSTTDDSTTDDSTTDDSTTDDSTTDDSTTDDSTTDDSTTDDSTTDDNTTDDSTTDDSTTDDSTTDDSTTEAPPPACPDKKPGCIDCTTKGKCDDSTGTLTPDGTCSPNEACIVVGSVPVCKPIAETTCNCGGNSQGCDPFDVNQPIYCISGKLYQADPCASGQKCSGAGECVAGSAPSNPAAACTGTKPEFRLVTPACTTGVFCAGTEVVETTKCKETEYFDLQSASCKAFPPPNPCGCGKTKCPIIMGNCTNYAVCDGNTLIDEESCIGSNNKFDFDNQACASAATGPCAPYKDCTFTSDSSDDGSSSGSSSGSATTIPPKPSTCNATNAGKRYPHETECKKYYTCREVSRDKYDYVNGKCIGKLVFNPANSYCDLVGNVLGCQT